MHMQKELENEMQLGQEVDCQEENKQRKQGKDS